ncbi:alpha/beta hydrolase [Micromonospora sp. 15K316]|uniref:alpha/beta fold hydrolase n=1 Tax=Micromonospora sp. 15K316 TaxID=2530376 RepID=UPI0010502CA1|nr:alpha/beta hydrolase [Micromonospora sp. 15K316]TDC38780.1 alpha/beta hydrolase [Micromonospora sp. 15K316]
MNDHVRGSLTVNGRRLSYLDFGGPDPVLIALHGHFSEGADFAPLAERLGSRWRVIALDQRGHGESDRATDYDRGGYVGDVMALLDHLGLAEVALLGHSLGGVNAYQFAARHPDRVTALVVEDIGAVCDIDLTFAQGLPERAATRDGLVDALGNAAPYLERTFRQRANGWGFSFDPADTVRSQQALTGDHWHDWLNVRCPTLLIRGTRSDELSAGHARDMAEKLSAALVELPAGHVVHHDQPDAYAECVRRFLATVNPAASR